MLKLFCGAVTRIEFMGEDEVSVKVLPIILWSESLDNARLEAYNEGLKRFGPDMQINTSLIEVPKSVVYHNELSESEFAEEYPDRER